MALQHLKFQVQTSNSYPILHDLSISWLLVQSSPIYNHHLHTALSEFPVNPPTHHILPLYLTCSASNDLPYFFAGATPTCLSRFRVSSLMGLVLTVQVRLSHNPFLMRLFPGLEGQTYPSGACMSGDSCVSRIKPWTPVHLHPWCPGPHLEWRRDSVHVYWAKLLSRENEALKTRAALVRPCHISWRISWVVVEHGEDAVPFPTESSWDPTVTRACKISASKTPQKCLISWDLGICHGPNTASAIITSNLLLLQPNTEHILNWFANCPTRVLRKKNSPTF